MVCVLGGVTIKFWLLVFALHMLLCATNNCRGRVVWRDKNSPPRRVISLFILQTLATKTQIRLTRVPTVLGGTSKFILIGGATVHNIIICDGHQEQWCNVLQYTKKKDVDRVCCGGSTDDTHRLWPNPFAFFFFFSVSAILLACLLHNYLPAESSSRRCS